MNRKPITKAQAIALIRKAELAAYRAHVEDRVQPYTRYVVDHDFLRAHGLSDHPRIAQGL